MANLPETPQWEEGVYQIEVSDPVLGGPDGISNRQAKQLASRTSYLKQKVEKGGTDLAAHIAAADPHTQYAPKASPTFTGTPTAPTPAANDNSKKLVTTEFVARAIAALAGTAPETLDTLKELADALGNDPNFATTVLNKLAEKLAKDQNGADIPDPALFVKNLGLPEVSANGKNFVSDGGHRRITAGDGTHQAVLSDTGYFGVKDKDGSVWEFNPSGVLIAGSVPVSRLTGTDEITVPVGTVIMVAHNKQVAGRLLRTNGTAVSRTAYADLFAAIGTTYGAGDGSTTFNLPDTRDDFPRFAGDSRSVGSKQGDAMRNIVGSYATAKPNTSTILNHASGPFKIVEDTSQWYSVQTAPSVGSNHVMMFNLENTSLPLASENRPRNIALAGWIRY
ncbi:tail fiber protein [Yersinia enterocolitica]|nr:tail fiber protein [Yersinia enterocolitica]